MGLQNLNDRMQSQWSDKEANEYIEKVVLEETLHVGDGQSSYFIVVLHGGGNTSVKLTVKNLVGDSIEVLAIKGSGWDLSNIEPQGFPLVDLEHCRKLQRLESLEDGEMVKELRSHMLDPSSPTPSVETLLHASFDPRWVDHSHADAILALVDQPEGERICREVYGEKLAIVPYVMPGFLLSKKAKEIYDANKSVEGVMLLQHGLFTFGSTAKESYERHIAFVSKALEYIQRFPAKSLSPPLRLFSSTEISSAMQRILPLLRGIFSEFSNGSVHWVTHHSSSVDALSFANSREASQWSERGALTPDHVLRTKGIPLFVSADLQLFFGGPTDSLRNYLREHVEKYIHSYADYFRRQNSRVGGKKIPLDFLPRVLLIEGLGVVTVGKNPKETLIAADIMSHTFPTILAAEAIGKYFPVEEKDRFDMEYWRYRFMQKLTRSLEQAKLSVSGSGTLPLNGLTVFITGAASGIGKATAFKFGSAGASLFLTDCDEKSLKETAEEFRKKKLQLHWRTLDVTRNGANLWRLDGSLTHSLGVDILISNAGKAFQSPQGMADCPEETLQSSLSLNFLAHQSCAAAATSLMKLQGTGGVLLFNISKAAINPGKNFGPYCVAKAATMALMKQYALEYGSFGIRSNAVNADRVRTNLFSPELIAERAAARNLNADEYFRSNLLKEEVLASDVAEAFYSLALASKTTGGVFTVDGGNIEASLR